MYESRKADIDTMRARFDREIAERLPAARATAHEYLGMLTALIDKVESGPVGDPRLAELEEWAEKERHRVRRALMDIA